MNLQLVKLTCCIPNCKNTIHNEHHFCKKHSKKYIFDKEEECPICFEQMDDVEYPLLDCGHWIHIECVLNSNQLQCPVCRTPISKKYITAEVLDKHQKAIQRREKEEKERNIREILQQESVFPFIQQLKLKSQNLLDEIIFSKEELFQYLRSKTKKIVYKDLERLTTNHHGGISASAQVLKQHLEQVHNNNLSRNVDMDIVNFIFKQITNIESKVFTFCKEKLNKSYYN